MVEGKIVNVSGAKVTLADGTELMIPSTVKVQRADLKPGATVINHSTTSPAGAKARIERAKKSGSCSSSISSTRETSV